MPTYRSLLLNTLNSFATNSYSDGYDWNDVYDYNTFEDLNDGQLYNLLLDYLDYIKGE